MHRMNDNYQELINSRLIYNKIAIYNEFNVKQLKYIIPNIK